MGIAELVYNSPTFIRNTFINAYGYRLYRLRFNKKFWLFYNTLIEHLEYDSAELNEIYFSNLKNTLIQAAEIKYYRNVFAEKNFIPEEFNQFDQLKLLPVLNKKIIRENYSDFINRDYEKNGIVEHSTSGTTGEKFKFLIPKELLFFKSSAFIYRQYYLLGIKPFDRRVTIGGRIFTRKPPYWSYNRFENQLLLSAHHLSHSTIDSYIAKIEEFSPIFMQGHPTIILYLAEHILENSIELKFKPKGIFTTGETLEEFDRERIEKAFNTIVLQQYGSGESIISAFEGPDKKGYYADIERGFIELVPDSNNSNPHRIIGTSFLNPYMPFIRYDMGDIAEPVVKNGLSNSNSLPLVFKTVLGRTDDVLTNINGEKILPVKLRMLIKLHLKDSTNYQIIQIEVNNYQLLLVDKNRQINTSSILNTIKTILGSKAEIELNYVDSILSDGGKVRNIINKTNK